jgi:AraC-like DNA-binding protein
MKQSDAGSRPAAAPVVTEQWETRDRETYCDAVRRWFPGTTNFSFDGSAADFKARVSTLALEKSRLLRYSNTGTEFDFSMLDTMSINFPIQGRCSYTTKKGDVRGAPGGVAITQYGERVRVGLHPAYSGLVLLVSDAALLRQANALLGTDTVTRLQDLGAGAATLDIRKGPGAVLARSAFGALKEAEALAQVGLGRLIQSETYDHLANLLLVASLPKLRRHLELPQKRPGTRAIERAREYLEAQAGEAVRISDLANELGISVRALQLGFREQLGKTPVEFLFECRLQKARMWLLSASPGASVTSIAIECGFANVGAFAGRYQRTFGELPSETLGRRRG